MTDKNARFTSTVGDISSLHCLQDIVVDSTTGPAQEAVQKILDKAVKDDGPAGIVFASIDKTGKMLACASAGVRSLHENSEPVSDLRDIL